MKLILIPSIGIVNFPASELTNYKTTLLNKLGVYAIYNPHPRIYLHFFLKKKNKIKRGKKMENIILDLQLIYGIELENTVKYLILLDLHIDRLIKLL